jgi:hypothetical protein
LAVLSVYTEAAECQADGPNDAIAAAVADDVPAHDVFVGVVVADFLNWHLNVPEAEVAVRFAAGVVPPMKEHYMAFVAANFTYVIFWKYFFVFVLILNV